MRPLSVTNPGRPFSDPAGQKEEGDVFCAIPCETDLFFKGMVVDPPCDLGHGACAVEQGATAFLAFSVPVTSVTDTEYTVD